MKRRKFLVGMGSLAAGGATAMGTGAFTSVEADRDVEVAVAGDASAFLALDATNAANGYYASETGDDGELTISIGDLDDGSRDRPASSGGTGLNQDAVTVIRDIFRVRNQGTQQVEVDLQSINGGDLIAGKPYPPKLLSTEVISDSDDDKAYIWFNYQADSTDIPDLEMNKYGSNNEVELAVSDQVQVDIGIRVAGEEFNKSGEIGNIKLVADAGDANGYIGKNYQNDDPQ